MKPRILATDVAGEGDPLVLLPGGLTGWISWIPHQERLAADYRVIRVQPIHNEMGSAGEPGDPSYTKETAVESLRLTLDDLEIESAHFAGWSAGGKGLLDFAVAYPERARSLTLIEPAAYWILDRVREMDPSLSEYIQYLHSLGGKNITEDDLATFLHEAGFVEDPATARSDPYWERGLPHRMTLSWLSEDLMGSEATLADLARIRCPVLLTKGSTTVGWEQRVVDLLAEYLPVARVVELEGDHAHHIQSIDRFLEELETHLSAIPVS